MNVFEQKNAELVTEFDRYVRELKPGSWIIRTTFTFHPCFKL